MDLDYRIKISNETREKIVKRLEKNPRLRLVLDVDNIIKKLTLNELLKEVKNC